MRDVPARLFIRGVGRVPNSLGTGPGIAVYRDQVYVSEIGVLNRAISLTTERVEVLRGPRGTLFGRNATGGLGGTSNPDVRTKKGSEQIEDQSSHELQILSMTDSPLQWVDAMATWFSPAENVRVILSGKNLTDEETYVSLQQLNTFGVVSGCPYAPRTCSLEVQYDF